MAPIRILFNIPNFTAAGSGGAMLNVDVFVLPSLPQGEGRPVALLEAMSAAPACIESDVRAPVGVEARRRVFERFTTGRKAEAHRELHLELARERGL